ncbi:hypothetical protein ACOME3_009732 [Neoechinorhynchus agilis]
MIFRYTRLASTTMIIRRYAPSVVSWGLFLFVSVSYFTSIQGSSSWKSRGASDRMFILYIIHIIVFFYTCTNFVAACKLDPGFYAQDSDEMLSNASYQEIVVGPAKGVNALPRRLRSKYCQTCEFYRPPRCSHCIGCVEYFNGLANRINQHGKVPSAAILADPVTIIAIIVALIDGIMIFPMFGLTVFHSVLIANGRTTNEQVTGRYKDLDHLYGKGSVFKNFAFLCFGSRIPYLGDRIEPCRRRRRSIIRWDRRRAKANKTTLDVSISRSDQKEPLIRTDGARNNAHRICSSSSNNNNNDCTTSTSSSLGGGLYVNMATCGEQNYDNLAFNLMEQRTQSKIRHSSNKQSTDRRSEGKRKDLNSNTPTSSRKGNKRSMRSSKSGLKGPEITV